MQFIGFYIWSKNMNDQTKEVTKNSMSNIGRSLLIISIAFGTIGYGLLWILLRTICGLYYSLRGKRILQHFIYAVIMLIKWEKETRTQNIETVIESGTVKIII